MKRLFFIPIFLILLLQGIKAQDFIYTIIGEIDGTTTSIDLIYVKNFTKYTVIKFANLAILDEYKINMRKWKIEAAT
jgi:hypothetical protein